MKIIVTFVLFALCSFSEMVAADKNWPHGQYCLPMPSNKRCPDGWMPGYRRHDANNYAGSAYYNYNYNYNRQFGHVPDLKIGTEIHWGFCCKIHAQNPNVYKLWPKGSYCIFRKGGDCPTRFEKGSIFWDDEDTNNRNSYSGTLPDGEYGKNTEIHFCCRSDGEGSLIDPPSHETFMLMRYKGSCPYVSGYRRPFSGYLDWDTENSLNENKKNIEHPDGESRSKTGIKIEFCTYIHN